MARAAGSGSCSAGWQGRTRQQCLDRLDDAAQRQLLTEVFADAGWEVPRILAALDHTSWFFERLTQVRMRHWTAGRAALAGDTAWAPTPVTAWAPAWPWSAPTSCQPNALRRERQPLRSHGVSAGDGIFLPAVWASSSALRESR
jgi:hypothetical protein